MSSMNGFESGRSSFGIRVFQIIKTQKS